MTSQLGMFSSAEQPQPSTSSESAEYHADSSIEGCLDTAGVEIYFFVTILINNNWWYDRPERFGELP